MINKLQNHKWKILTVIFFISVSVLFTSNYIYERKNDYAETSYDWAEDYFYNRVQELVGAEKYKEISEYYKNSRPNEFLGCEDYLFEPKSESANDLEISRLMEEKKYEEVIAMGDKYLSDSGVWYCDPYFWTQRAKAFLSLNNCLQAEVEAAHAFAIAPSDNGNDEPEKELYFSIHNSSVCKK